MNKEKEFEWTDELVKEFMDKYNSIGNWIDGIDPDCKMKEFKAMKVFKAIKLKEELKHKIMEKEKVYILQKDLPNGKAGDEYVCINSNSFYYKDGNMCAGYWHCTDVENNPEWFKLKEEVKPIVWTHNNDGVEINGISEGISFTLNDRLKVFYITKERLAEIIIAESKGMLNIIEPISSEDVKEYSKKEYLKFGEDCWKAARLKERILYNPNLQQQQNWSLQNQQQNCSYQAVDKYKTLSEYLNDKQKPK